MSMIIGLIILILVDNFKGIFIYLNSAELGKIRYVEVT